MKKLLMILPLVFVLCFAFGCQKGEEVAEEPGVDVEPTITVDNAFSPDGVSIAYEVRGEGEPALVFIHGWCCDRSYWNEQLPHFAQKHKVVAIDLAGHGESGLDRKEWTMGAFGEDVVSVVNKLNLDQVVLVGHSMGGFVILEAARRMEFPRKNGHPKKFELHPDNTPKGFFDSRPSVFSVDCKRFQYTQRWPDGLDLCCGKSLGEQVLSSTS